MLIRAFITHKDAENFNDCQDRFSINSDTKSIALSDGMSQSIFQKYWAEILVNTYTSNLEWYPDIHSVRKLSPLWMKKVHMYVEKQKEEGKNPWRVERNLSDGLSAGATFLGIRFDGNKWVCQVLGDSCLVNIHNNQITNIISSEKDSSFNNYPDYYDSNPQNDGKGELIEEYGQLGESDAILLVTDPFSDFLLRNRGTEEEKNFINQLLHIKSHEEYEKVVDEWRKKGMHNDDSTLIIILPDGSKRLNLDFEDNIKQLIEGEKTKIKTSINEISPSATECQLLSEMKTRNLNQESKEGTSKEDYEHQKSINWGLLFNEEFSYNLKVTIYTNLRRFMILRKQRMEIAQVISNEIKTLISHSLMKK